MKLAKRTKDGWRYELNQQEGDCLLSLLRQFPITTPTPAKISNSDTDPEMVEREKLLNESLAEHREELKKQATDLLARKFKWAEKGYLLSLGQEEREILLQILNDIRIGSWRVLGEPEDLEKSPVTEKERGVYDLMNLAGYFEFQILKMEEAEKLGAG
jgi:hypothetical protein